MGLIALDKAEQLENLAADLYAIVAARADIGRETRRLFEQLRQEEHQHALRIRMLRSQCAKDSRLARGIALVGGAIDLLLARANQVKERLADPDLGLPEILAVLAELEQEFQVAHAEVVASDAAPDLKAFFRKLAKQDEAHARLLGSLAQAEIA
jgi:rubrerythrin